MTGTRLPSRVPVFLEFSGDPTGTAFLRSVLNKSRRTLACALGACLITLLSSSGFGQANKFCFKFDAGGNIAEDVDLKELLTN